MLLDVFEYSHLASLRDILKECQYYVTVELGIL